VPRRRLRPGRVSPPPHPLTPAPTPPLPRASPPTPPLISGSAPEGLDPYLQAHFPTCSPLGLCAGSGAGDWVAGSVPQWGTPSL